jgi:transcriptional regulator with XRE-family HTH domain
MPFHENLRTLRLARGLTQPLLAEKAGIEQSYLSKLENGPSRPSEDVLGRLAQALEVKPEALQNGDETEERTRRWQRVAVSSGAALVLVAAFLAGRATAVYPLSFGQVISGADAADDLPQQIMKLAPAGVEVIMLSRNGPGGSRISIMGAAPDTAAVDDYMETVRKRYGGSFISIHVSAPQSGRLQDFELDYMVAGGR